jgi:hypothetical protein
MKKLLVIIGLSILLPGCALVDAYLMTKYDPNEYKLITEIRADAQLSKKNCDDSTASKMNARIVVNKTHLFELYSQEVPRNTNVINASKDLHEIAQGLDTRYNQPNPVSPAYCKLKFESIENNASTMQHTIGARPR